MVAAFDAQPSEATDELFDLVRLLIDLGITTEVLLIGDGERLAELRRLVPVTITNDFRWRGIALATSIVRADRATRALKGRRLRRWLHRRDGAAWILQVAVVSPILAHSSREPSTVLIHLPAATAFEGLDATVREHVGQARMILADGPTLEVSGAAEFGRETVALGDLTLPAPDDHDPSDPGRWPVLLVPTADAWTQINHTDEIVRHLVTDHPEVEVLWVVADGQDRWLAEHDRRVMGLPTRVVFATPDDVQGRLVRAVVRTGYGTAHAELLARARRTGVPTFAFGDPGEMLDHERVAPFAVDDLLSRLDRVLTDPDTLVPMRTLVREQAEHRERVRTGRARFLECLGIGGS